MKAEETDEICRVPSQIPLDYLRKRFFQISISWRSFGKKFYSEFILNDDEEGEIKEKGEEDNYLLENKSVNAVFPLANKIVGKTRSKELDSAEKFVLENPEVSVYSIEKIWR